ncbi:MAG: hypothetical protein V4736_04370 [Bdellovibrionota bacterium]
MQITNRKKILNFLIQVTIFTSLPLFGFNCMDMGPLLRQPATEFKSLADTGRIENVIPLEDYTAQTEFGFQPKAVPALMNFNQIYHAMLNLTGQTSSGLDSEAGRTYVSVRGSLTDASDINEVTGSGILSTNTLAGEVCNSLLNKESRLMAAQRTFFPAIMFNRGLETVTNGVTTVNMTEAVYLTAASEMALNFWDRSMTAEETALFTAFRNDYFAGLTATERAAAKETKGILLGTCVVMLSAVEDFTY